MKTDSKRQSTYRYSSWCVQMDDAADVRAGLVDCRVQSEGSLADAQPCWPRVHNLSTNIDLGQCTGSDFRVQHAKWVDQEVFMFLTHPCLKHIFLKFLWMQKRTLHCICFKQHQLQKANCCALHDLFGRSRSPRQIYSNKTFFSWG